MLQTNHTWKFFRAGGVDQVRFESGEDLANLDQLDQKLWVALACPTTGLEFDQATLALVDTDHDGRIRAPELIAAVKWAAGLLKNPDSLLKGEPVLRLDAINDATPEGKQILASAKRILASLGKPDATEISLSDVADAARAFAQTLFNGDGVVPAEAAPDDATRAVIADIISCLGPEQDRSGRPGVNQAKVDRFFAEAAALVEWSNKAAGNKTVLPLGDATAAAAAAVKAVKAKVDDYFARCRLAAFDPRAAAALNRQESDYLALAAKDLSITADEIAGFPLAQVAPNKPLPLFEGVNPAWAGALATLHSAAVKPLLGDKTAITEADWVALQSKLAPYEAWLASKPPAAVEKLGISRVREILAGTARQTITDLIARDKALEPEFNAISTVERLLRYHRDLCKLCNNFVSFRDFYRRKDKAIFQVGTLYMDQRSCDLCLPVEDVGKHAALAGLAGMYLAYCECTRKSTGEKRLIVAAFTDGDSDNLMVGRNGIFYDRKGRDWDATIIKIVENPISLRQAFWSPYKKFVRMIEEYAAKRAAAAEAAATAKLETAAVAVTTPEKAKPIEPKKIDVGTVAALGVAFGAIGTAVSFLATGLAKLALWQIPLVIFALMLIISGPSVFIAWLKLRKRNLGPLLDANGWAVNTRAKISVPLGRSLTQVAALPPGAHRDLFDPFAEKKSVWPKVAVAVVVLLILYGILNSLGYIYEWTGGRLGKPKRPAPAAGETQPGPVQAGTSTSPTQ
ncbi:MAG: hypothetical protein N2379_03360 [Verrucomicrobiae bacterium]|nr:hypothetical protein [Verrucomicrobiae bacterium]